MKKFIMSILLVTAALTGCEKDPLDITPDGRIGLADVFASHKLTQSYLNSCYGYIPRYGTKYFFFTMLAAFSDEAHDNDIVENLMATAWYNGALTPSFNPIEGPNNPDWNGNFYGGFWAGIRKTNVFLANIDKATVEMERGRMKAEAKLLRAFYYSELTKMYGPMPMVDKPFDINQDFSKLTRPTFDEVAQFIAKDCDEAIAEAELPFRISKGDNERGRFTKAMAYAIKAKVLLFNASPLWNPAGDQAKWQAAATAAKQAITVLTANGYALFPNYETYFLNSQDPTQTPSDRETIFEINDRDAVFGGAIHFVHGIPSLGAFKAGNSPSQELVDAYDMKNGQPAILGYADADHLQPIINPASGYDPKNPYQDRDPRLNASVVHNGTDYGVINGQHHIVETFVGGSDGLGTVRQRTQNGYYLRKFIDVDLRTGQNGNGRWKKLRLAELYLNLAEAENEANGPAEAAEPINVVRRRAGMPDLPTGLSKDEMRVRIRRERQVELAFEEHRFWDVRRWKILDQTDKLTTGMQITKNGDGTFNYTRFVVERRRAWEDKHLLFPLPLNEVSVLPNFTQNPNW